VEVGGEGSPGGGHVLFWTLEREWARTPGEGTPLWGQGGRGPQWGPVSVSWVRTGEVRRHNKMSGGKEDDPITASRDHHAQSKCQRASINNSVNIRHKHCASLYYCFRKINNLVLVPFAFILWCTWSRVGNMSYISLTTICPLLEFSLTLRPISYSPDTSYWYEQFNMTNFQNNFLEASEQMTNPHYTHLLHDNSCDFFLVFSLPRGTKRRKFTPALLPIHLTRGVGLGV
jgi:hypothetical protein